MFTYKLHKKILGDGVKLTIKGEKQNLKHEFTTKISYKELQKIKYEDFVENMLFGLEKKIDMMLIDNIY
mgnify:CR=1 FL=1|jgi:hypothetical protein|tara:strand:+ start:1951 stop:2157 length:207 start_codon:yes stop_codon:yes gene_type:complete